MGLFDQCHAYLAGIKTSKEEPKPFKIERHRFPGSDGRCPPPDLVSIQPLTRIGEARFDLIERAQELARKKQEDQDDEAR
jgi:hypothetical protein